MNSNQIRQKFVEYFEKNGHKKVSSSSLIPTDPSVLFTTAGMQQFKPYYLDPESAPAKNVVSIQKCLRTSDIDEVGDESHLTFFEMLGNFSFGGYWKKEAIGYAHEFITKELGLKIDYVSVFEGDSETPADDESEKIWQQIDSTLTIKKHSREDNFWGPTGDEGPCGPTTEIYINGVEIWNIVFNEFYKTKDGKYEPLKIRGIDTGMGLERLAMVVQRTKNIFETDLFESIFSKIRSQAENIDDRSMRVIADHLKASLFLIADGVQPSNKEQGYIVRRLIRRASTFAMLSGEKDRISDKVAQVIVEKYVDSYPELKNANIFDILSEEDRKFRKTLETGLKEIEKDTDPFILFTSYGFPIELTVELAKKKGKMIDVADFNQKMQEHQKLSQTASAGMFKGGLASHSDKIVRLHTATHLLNAALRKVLGENVWQKGSNITEERTRFDFTHDKKLTDVEKQEVERQVNGWISRDLSVKNETLALDEARKLGAIGVFGEKYPDQVSVYTIYDKASDEVISREFCGGPHVSHTGAIASFKIQKEEAVSAGVRRIKAIIT